MPSKAKNEAMILNKARELAEHMNSVSVPDLGELRLKIVGIVDPQSTHMSAKGSMQLGVLDENGAVCRVDHVKGGRINGQTVTFDRFTGAGIVEESIPLNRLDNFCAP